MDDLSTVIEETWEHHELPSEDCSETRLGPWMIAQKNCYQPTRLTRMNNGEGVVESSRPLNHGTKSGKEVMENHESYNRSDSGQLKMEANQGSIFQILETTKEEIFMDETCLK